MLAGALTAHMFQRSRLGLKMDDAHTQDLAAIEEAHRQHVAATLSRDTAALTETNSPTAAGSAFVRWP